MHIGVYIDIFMVMAEIPVLEVCRVIHGIQKLCYRIRFIMRSYERKDVGWAIVSQDVVNGMDGSEILLCLKKLLVRRHFLRPP